VEGVLIGAYTAAGLRGLYGGRLQATTDFLADDGDFNTRVLSLNIQNLTIRRSLLTTVLLRAYGMRF